MSNYPSHGYWRRAIALYLATHQGEAELIWRGRLAGHPDVWRA